MMRNELEIVYATIKSVVSSFSELSSPPRFVFDYDPKDVTAGPFPTVGIRRYSDSSSKMIDKNEEYTRTIDGVKTYAWYEIGRFDYGCTVGLFMIGTPNAPNPIPFLRRWEQHVSKSILQKVRFTTVGDVIPNEFVDASAVAQPFEQQGKLLYSIKFSISVRGKVLSPVEIKAPVTGTNNPWKIHADPNVFLN